MTAAEARDIAIALLRRRLATGWWSRAQIESTVYEGASDPAGGYEIRGGNIMVPWIDGHSFRLSALLDEIEAPQQRLFG